MEYADIQPPINTYHRKLAATDLRFKRYLHNRINWNSIATCLPSKTFRKLLMVIAENVPLEPNINKLASQLESTRDQTLKMLYLLDRAGLQIGNLPLLRLDV